MVKTYIKSLLLIAVFVLGVSLHTALPVAAQSATYSCGAYGGGNYSETECASGGATGGGTSQDSVKPPDTGFAKLMQPTNLIALIASILAILAGLGIIFHLRRQRQ